MMRLTPAVTREHLVVSVLPDDGIEVHPDTMERLLRVPVVERDAAPAQGATDALMHLEEERQRELLVQAERQNSEWLEAESEKLDGYADDLERAFEVELKALEAELREAKKALRGSDLPMAEKLAERRRISALEAKRDQMKAEFFDRRATLRAEVETMLDSIQESLKMQPTLASLFTIRWEVA